MGKSIFARGLGLFFVLGLALHAANTGADTEGELEVLMITPNTENVIDVEQVTITFNKQMVPLGDYEKLAADFPIQISPKVECNWRWLNGSTIACQLNAPLPPSNQYHVAVPAGIKSLDGKNLKKSVTEKFTTLHWEVVNTETEWTGPDTPKIYFSFNQAMDANSLQQNVTSDCGKVSVQQTAPAKAEDLGVDPKRSYVFSYAAPIGISKACALGINGTAHSATGSVQSKPYNFSFQTFPEFKITEVRCGGMNTKVNPGNEKIVQINECNPDSGVSVSFSAPTTGKNLSGKITTAPFFGWTPGSEGSPEYYLQNGEEEYSSIYLRSPMLGAGKHTIKFAGLKDRFGRSLTKQDQINVSTSDFSSILQLPEGYGVIEKTGPHQLAVGGVNTKSFDLEYFTSQKVGDITRWNSYDSCRQSDSDKKKEKSFFDRFTKNGKTINTNGQKNIPFSIPIDLSTVEPDFKYGMFVGKIESAKDISGADFSAHRVCSNFFTVVTDLGILAKVGFYNSGIWVHSIRTGEPVKGVKVGLYGNSSAIFEGTTNDQGYAEGPGRIKFNPEGARFNYSSNEKLFVVAESKEDFSVLPFEEGTKGIDSYEFGQYSSKLRQSTNLLVHSITDRPLYKPGQQVNVKIFARHWEPRNFGLSSVKEVPVEVRDAMNKVVFAKNIKLSDFGTGAVTFNLESTAPLGTYYIQAKVGEYFHGIGTFDVYEFTLPVFQVKVETKNDSFQVGAAANFQTMARYHFGGGVPKTKGEYVVNFSPSTWSPKAPKWDSYSFDHSVELNIPGFERPRSYSGFQVAAGTLTTDQNGDAQVGVILPAQQIKTFGTIEYGISFKDDRGKSIAGFKSANVFYSKFNVGIRTPKWAYEAKEAITPEVVVLDQKENTVAGVKVNLKLIHRTYKTVRKLGSGSYYYYDTKTKDKEIGSCDFTSSESAKGCALKTVAAGDHYIVATARDSKGRVVHASIQKYVTGKEYIGWYRENHDRIDVIPDKRNYKFGETAKLLIKNPYPEVNALITLERFGVLRQFRHKLTKGAEILSIPIDSKDLVPGFYVAVQLIIGRVSEKIEGGVDLGKPSFKMGMTKINVFDPATVLTIAAKPEKEQYEPRDQTKVSLAVTSPGGQDVAELSVAVVDEKILQLSGSYESKYKLHEQFYELNGTDVETSQMLSFLIGRRSFGKKGAPAGGDGDDGKNLRQKILPLAYWNPSVVTDKNGKATVNFTLPDNLTTWRVLVVAADKKHRFGFGSGTFRTSKKVMVEPALPSFLTEGDKLNSRFTVFNRSGSAASIKADLKVTGVDLDGASTKEANIPNDGKSYFEWKVQAPYGKTKASFSMLASTEKGKDGIKETIPIYPYASYDTFANYGSTTGTKVDQAVQIPEGIRPELGGLEVITSPSLISHLDDAFKYMFSYPYSCWEQTITRAAALSQYLRLKDYLSITDLEKDPKPWAIELVNQMPKFQYSNGGMAFWKPENITVDPYLSVFTALAIQWIAEAKVDAPSEPTKNLMNYVRRLVQGQEAFPKGYTANARATVLAMAVLVLAKDGKTLVPTINKLFQERKNLSLFGKSFLWMAAAAQPETKAVLEQIKKEIYSASDLTSGTIQFKEAHDDGFVQILHTSMRTNCSILSAMLKEDPKGSFIEPLVRMVIDARKSNRWNNTQENLYCQNALAQYSAVYEKDIPNYTVKGKAMEQPLKGTTVKSFKDKPQSETFAFSPALVGKKTNIALEKSGKGRLYYTARMRIAYKEVRTTPVNSGMQVTRTYFLKMPDGSFKKQGTQVKMKRGDIVKVVLAVSITALRNQVVLDDRLPAGLEPVNTALGGTSKEDAKGEKDSSAGSNLWNEDDNWYGFYSSGGFYHREMRMHAVQYFADYLGKGNFELAYLAQAIATGEFNANPALIEQMYEPEVYGKSSPAQFIIEE